MAVPALLPTGEFPFEFLHAEIVNFLFQEEEENTQKLAQEAAAQEDGSENLISSSSGDTKISISTEPESHSSEGHTPARKQKSLSFENSFGKINAATKLEFLGYRVGYSLSERISKEYPRFTAELDCLKFICKEFWTTVFRKQVDNLRTNHQGVYVIQDNKFWLLTAFSTGHQYRDYSPRYLSFSCGLIRGSLANMNVQAVVTASVETMPAVKFNIHVQHK